MNNFKKLLDPIVFIPFVLFVPIGFMMIGKFYQMLWSILFPCVDKYCTGEGFAPFFLTLFTGISLLMYFLINATK